MGCSLSKETDDCPVTSPRYGLGPQIDDWEKIFEQNFKQYSSTDVTKT